MDGNNHLVQEIIQNLTVNINDVLKHIRGVRNIDLDLDLSGIVVRKKTRDLQSGDIIVPNGCIQLEKNELQEVLKEIQDIYEGKTSYVERVDHNQYNLLAIFLDRPSVFPAILTEVMQRGSQYGHKRQYSDCGTVLLKNVPHRSVDKWCSLNGLRHRILFGHVRKLLEANGYSVVSPTLQCDDGPIASIPCHTTKTYIDKVIECRDNQIKTSCGGSDECTQEQGMAKMSSVNVYLDLKRIISERGLRMGKGGFDVNLNNVAVVENGAVTDVLRDVISLEEHIEQSLKQGAVRGCVHLVAQAQSVRQQQVQLVHHTLCGRQLDQSQVIVGPVVGSSCQVPSDANEDIAELFQRLRFERMKETSESRQGDNPEEITTRATVLTQASITMDVLQNAAHIPLRLDFDGGGQGAEIRLGTFIMYNVARLATLIQRFQAEVEKGTYPPLPALSLVDFRVLREKEEWELVYLYIAAFPDIVAQCVESVFAPGTNVAKIHTQKVTNYLKAFSKSLSAYYSQYHILGGREEHLLPLMYARIHLMRAVHQVMVNALDLLGVTAVTYL